MARKTVNPAMLQGLVAQSQEQVIQKGTPRTTDPNFPVFATPVNEKILVYIPKTTVREDHNGETLDVLHSILHDYHKGNSFGTLRCIHGLQGEAFEELGYDGSCPACEAIPEEWELYNAKMEAEAKQRGISLDNDPNDLMKSTRQELLKGMSLKAPDEYVTFPVVIIRLQPDGSISPEAINNLEPVFVHFRKKRYNEKVLGALKALMNAPAHLGGQIMSWDFTYDTQGKPADAMNSAKNATYTVIRDGDFLNDPSVQAIVAKAEEVAQPFTLFKAAEVVTAVQFLYKEDLDAEVSAIMRPDRQMLELYKMKGSQALEAPQQQNTLANFGQEQSAPQTQQGQQAQQNNQAFGGNAQFGATNNNPVNFG